MKTTIQNTFGKTLTATLLLMIGLLMNPVYGQAPQAMKYQGVARDNVGNELSFQSLGLRLSIVTGSPTGTSVYSETQNPTTNEFGLFNVQIGNGTFVSGNFSTIDWGSDSHYLKVEMDETGGTNYNLMGASELLSVPYALYAETTGDTTGTSVWLQNADTVYYNAGNVGVGTTSPSNPLTVESGTNNVGIRLNDGSGNERVQMAHNSGIGGYTQIRDLSNQITVLFRGSGGNYLMSGNLGIGTTSPAALLDIVGDVKITDGTEGAGKVLTSGATGLASWQTPSATVPSDTSLYADSSGYADSSDYTWNADQAGYADTADFAWEAQSADTAYFALNAYWNKDGDTIYYNQGFVGIGTSVPSAHLHVAGPGTQVIRVNSATPNAVVGFDIIAGATVRSGYYWDGPNNVVKLDADSAGFGGTLSLNSNGGNVGIGNTTPVAVLDVAGDIKITDGTQGAGKVLTSDTAGLATWQTPAATVPSDTALYADSAGFSDTAMFALNAVWDQDGDTISYSSGNVGIGTSSPSAPLTVIANGPFPNNNGIYLSSTDVTQSAIMGLYMSGAGTGDPFVSFDIDAVGGWSLGTDNSDNAKFIISSSKDGLAVAPRLVIDRPTGNVGIGATAPTVNLEVLGTANTRIRIDAPLGNSSELEFAEDGAVGNGWAIHRMSGTNDLRFREAGSNDIMTMLKSNGNVGIGTTSPSEVLHVSTTTNWGGLLVEGGGIFGGINGIKIKNDGGYGYNLGIGGSLSATMPNKFMIFNDSTGNTALVVDTGGYIGIGTLYPLALLHASSPNVDSNASQIRVEGFSSGNQTYAAIEFQANPSSGGLLPVGRIKAYNTTVGYTNAKMSLQTIGAGPSFVDAMTLTNGMVGIGTIDPEDDLHVYSATDWGGIRVEGGTSAGGLNGLKMKNDVGYTYNISLGGSSNSTVANKLYFYNNNTGYVPFVIDSVGNVGIGTLYPLTRLHINNKITDDLFRVYNGDALMVVNQTPTSTSVLNDPEEVLYLGRQGTGAQAFGAMATFKLSRYENNGTNARTRLDLDLTHDAFTDKTVMTFLSKGSVGIGTFAPSTELEVVSVSNSGGITITGDGAGVNTSLSLVNSETGVYRLTISEGVHGDGKNKFFIQDGTIARVTLDSVGQFGIGTVNPDQRLTVNGGASKPGGGTWATFSDRRVKKDIVSFNDGLDVVMQIDPVRFRYNGLAGYTDDKKVHVGIIAQDMEKAAPYMIEHISKKLKDSDKKETDLLMYDGTALNYILVNAIKEQQAIIESQRSELDALKAEVSDIKSILDERASNK